MRRHLYISFLVSIVTLLPMRAQSETTAPVELIVAPESTQVTLKYNLEKGTYAKIDWGYGSSEMLKDPNYSYGGVAKHSYSFSTTKGMKITIDGSHLTMLQEPWASEGPLNVCGFGRIQAPVLEIMDFSYICTMEGNSTPYVLDLSQCRALRTLKVNSLKAIALPKEGQLEYFEITKNFNNPMSKSLEGELDLSQQR